MKKTFLLLWAVVACYLGNLHAQTNSVQLKTGTGTLVNSYNSVQAAYNAIPATMTQAYIIEVTSTYTGANETYPITLPAKTSGHSAANTITLRPASTATAVSISGQNNTGAIMVLDGVKYFTIDGRAGGTGSSRNLSIINNTLSSGNTVAHTILVQKGSANLAFRYVNIENSADLLGVRNLYFANTTTAAKNMLVEYCKITKGRTAIGVEGASSAVLDSVTIRANILEGWSFAGIWRFGSVGTLLVDSNDIYQPVVSTQSPHGGLLLDGSGTAGQLTITRNRIYSMQANSEVNGINIRNIGGQDILIANNLISMLAPNGATGTVYGIFAQGGTNTNNIKVYYNTIRIGGNYTGSAASGAINSSGIHKTNSSATGVYDFKNNIVINTRTGGSGVRHAGITVSNTNGTITADNNTYYSGTGDHILMGTTWFNNMNDYRAAILAPNELNSNINLIAFDAANSPTLDAAHNGDYGLVAKPLTQVTKDIFDNPRHAQFPYRGAYESSVPVDPNMVYRTSTAVQKDSSYVNKGAINQLVLKVEVNVTGVQNPITIDKFNFSLNGTTDLANLTALKVFYTGNNNEYADTMQYGTTLTTITNAFSITGSVVPRSGRNYFWLVADISNTAALCNLVDAQFTEITVNSVAKTPTVSDPAGFLKIKTYLKGTYTIDPALPNSCVPTGENFRSFAEFAFNLAARGIDSNVNVLVAPGTYAESIEFSPYYTTNPGYEVYVHSAGNNASTVKLSLAGGTTATTQLLWLNKVSGMRFEYMTFERTGSIDNAGAFNLDGCSNIIIRNNVFKADSSSTATNTAGNNSFIISSAASAENNILIERNIFSGNSNGIWMLGNSTNYSTGVKVKDNRFKSGYTAVYLQYFNAPEVTGNYITRNDSTVTTTYYGISFQNVSGRFIINRNELIFHNSIGYGIRLRFTVASASNKGLITNNLVQQAGTGTSYGISLEDDSKYAKIYNNTVHMNGGTSTASRGLYATSTGLQGFEIMNNIFANTGTGSVAYYIVNTSAPGIEKIDYNIYYSASANIAYWGANKTDIAALRSTNLMDSNSRVLLPDFISAKNLRLTLTDPLYIGNYVAEVTEDIDGNTRCVVPMIGGHELPDPPKAFIVDFSVPDTIFAGGRDLYINTALAKDRKYHSWFVDDVLVTRSRNLTHTFPTAGTYKLSLVTEGCKGIDSAVKQLTVIDPYDVPRVDFVASRNTLFVNEQIILRDLSTQAPTSWEWTITPDVDVVFDPTDQDPMVLFIASGKYDVCLTSENAFGKSTKVCKPLFIEVKELNKFCEQTSSSELSGRLLDDAGISGVYGNNKNCSFVIEPLCAENLTIDVTSWLVDDNDDMLFIYDGTSADPSKLLALYNGATKKPAGVVAPSGKALLVWVTDASAATDGFVVDWKAKEITGTAKAGFSLPDTGFVNSPVYVGNAASNAKITTWDVQHPAAINISENKGFLYHTYTTPGTYTVKQVVTGCSNIDSVEKDIVITNPIGLPVVDFTINRNVLTPADELILTDISTNGPLTQKWKVSPSAGVAFVQKDDSSHQVRAIFTNSGTYDITLVVTNANGVDSVVKAAIVKVIEYCIPTAGILSSETGISRVVFAGIDNTSAVGTEAYTDYANNGQVARVGTGAQYPITIERNSAATQMTRKVWIDWNQDGTLDNTTELVAAEMLTNTTAFTVNVSVPGTALKGFTRMRVGAGYQNAPATPCTAALIGEYEDYLVEVLGDLEKPVITLLGANSVVIEAGYGYTEAGATAFDNVDGNITSLIDTIGAVDTTTVGTYVLVYTVADADGNTDTVRRTVIVTPDVTAPVISLIGNGTDTMDVFTTYADMGAAAIDQPWGTNLTDSIKVTSTLDTSKLGTYTITYQVTDAWGNTSSVSRNVVVRDTVRPLIVLKGSSVMTIDVNEPFGDPGVDITDNYWQSFKTSVVNNVNINALGQYDIQYFAEDGSGNQALVATRTVNVVDRKAPVITLVGNSVVKLGRWQKYIDSGYILSDNYTDSANITIEVLGDWVNASVEGLYYIQYKATDSVGNVSFSEKRVIDVRGLTSVGSGISFVNEINLYPNPTRGAFTVAINLSQQKNTTIEVYDMLGKKIATTQPAIMLDEKVEMDITGLSKGSYFVKIIIENEAVTRSLVVIE